MYYINIDIRKIVMNLIVGFPEQYVMYLDLTFKFDVVK